MVRPLETKLSRPTILSEEFVRETETFKDALQGILSTPAKRGNRDDATIEGHVLQGKLGELGIAKLLNASVFDEKWDIRDRNSYAKDVVTTDGVRIEVKTHRWKRNHWGVPDHSYYQLITNQKHNLIDLVVFAFIESTSIPGYWSIEPTLIINPYPQICEFSALWDNGTGKYGGKVYRADVAYTRFLCHPLINLEV